MGNMRPFSFFQRNVKDNKRRERCTVFPRGGGLANPDRAADDREAGVSMVACGWSTAAPIICSVQHERVPIPNV